MAKELIRLTPFGKEYWDAEAKRTVFVPNVYADDKSLDIKLNSHDIKLDTVVAEPNEETTVIESNDKDTDETEPIDVNLDEMNANELRAFAKEHDIELHFSIKKEETIRAKIKEALAVDDAQ